MRAPTQLTFLTKRQLQLNSYQSASSTSTKSSQPVLSKKKKISQPAIYARVANNDGLLLHSNLYYLSDLKKKNLKKYICLINIRELIIPLGNKIKVKNDVKINII
jgi:hypothetical protein